MERILFRALGVSGAKKDKWCFGYYQKSPSLRYGNIVAYDGDGFGSFSHHKVNENTVGQFVGIQDSKGKDVYEGDIIQDEMGKWLVWYCEDIASFVLDVVGKIKLSHLPDRKESYGFDVLNADYEVVGNIFEMKNKKNKA